MFSDSPAIDDTRYAQPALFAVSYALGAALLELGVEPGFLIGHSVGEFAAAVLAEVLTLDDAARLVVCRGELMGQLPAGGAMSAVDVAANDVNAVVAAEPSCAVAAVNGPRSTVVSGPAEAIDRITRALAARGAKVAPLAVSHAFHSPAHGAGAGGIPRHRRRHYTPRSKDPTGVDPARRGCGRHRNGRRLLGRAADVDRPVRRRDRRRHHAGSTHPPGRTRPAADPGGPRSSLWYRRADPYPVAVPRT